MIKIKYKALFSLEFAHSFYKSGKSSDFELVPSERCAMLLKSLGLRFLPSEYGGKLYAKVNNLGGNDLMQNPLPDGIKFSFLIKLRSRVFDNITNINLIKPPGSRYYFNNLTSNLAADSTPLLVANTTSKIVTDNDLLQFVNKSFSSVQSSTAPTQTGKLVFTDSGEIAEQELNNTNNVFNHNFDLQHHENGRVKFLVDETEKLSFYTIQPNELADLFGVVEIFYRATLPTEYQFQNGDNSVTSRTYRIAFANRQTKWRYIITRKFNSAISSVTVAKSNGSPIAFTLLGGTPPGTFIATSNNAIPMSEEKVAGIKLTDNTNKVIIENLPNPPLNLIKTEGSDTFSDILITI